MSLLEDLSEAAGVIGLAEEQATKPPQDKVRALFIVELLGDRDQVEREVRRMVTSNHPKETYWGSNRMITKTAMIGLFPETLEGSAADAVEEKLKAGEVYRKMVEDEMKEKEEYFSSIAQAQGGTASPSTIPLPPQIPFQPYVGKRGKKIKW